ncbi:MAG: metallophosphoesterase [Anaerolineae bacterium]|nr:metallophosphoesterase [Thermoflexales bacterium]MDW8408431.1 metallophosphoesterase [Anaerolineae bacterium]
MSIESRPQDRLARQGIQWIAPIAYPARSAHMPSPLLTDWFLPIAGRLIAFSAKATLVMTPLGILLSAHGLATAQSELAAAGLLLAIASAVGLYARFIAPFQLSVRQLQIEMPRGARDASVGAQPLRVCFFSDLHIGRYKKAGWLSQVVRLVNAQSPDVVLIGGDFVAHFDRAPDARSLLELLQPLRDLHAPLGVFAVLGNHDYGLPGPNLALELERLLAEWDIRVLKNECIPIGRYHQLVAVDELWADRDNVSRAFGHADPTRVTLFLGHNPDLMAKVKPEHTAVIFLFGHTHAGQIYLPFLPGFGVPIKTNLYRGLHRLPQGMVYVSSGCGESETPIRLGTQPEIVIFEL